MKVLLLYPRFPDTFWSFRHALPFIGKRSSFPPLGLLTVSAMLPPHWERKLVDVNIEKLSDRDLRLGRRGFLERHAGPGPFPRTADRPLPESGAAHGGGRPGHERREPLLRGCGPHLPRRGGDADRGAGRRPGGGQGSPVLRRRRAGGHHPGASPRFPPRPHGQVQLDARPVLPGMPLQLRVLRRHRALRAHPPHQDDAPGAPGVRATAPPRVAGIGVHRRRQLRREQAGHQGPSPLDHRLDGQAGQPLLPVHPGVDQPGRGRRAALPDACGPVQQGVHRDRDAVRGMQPRGGQDAEREGRSPGVREADPERAAWK